MRCFDHDALMHASAALDAINEDYQLSTTGRDTQDRDTQDHGTTSSRQLIVSIKI